MLNPQSVDSQSLSSTDGGAKKRPVTLASNQLGDPLAEVIGPVDVRRSMWYFDFSFKAFIPHRFRDSGIEVACDDDRMHRRDLWAKYGRKMHVLNLEFEDSAVEIAFQKDHVRCSKRWVEHGVLIRAFWNLAVLVFEFQLSTPWAPLIILVTITAMHFLQYAQFYMDRSFVLRQFQHVLFFWTAAQAVLLALYYILSWNDDMCKSDAPKAQWIRGVHSGIYGIMSYTEGMAAFDLLALVIYRLRFVYFLNVNMVLLLGYFISAMTLLARYGADTACMPQRLSVAHLFVVAGGLTYLSYVMEILQRKDYLQSSMVYKETRRSDMLLRNILPEAVCSQLKTVGAGHAIARSYECATVFFADIVSFTTMSAQLSPQPLVELLNKMFRRFDSLAEEHGVEKIKTIGDCYMAVCGVPVEVEAHAEMMAQFGLDVLAVVESEQFKNPISKEPLQVRAGMHSGPVVAGVIGNKKFAYDLWGDTVNTASRMESTSEPNKLACSEDTYQLLKDKFEVSARGHLQVKGKGEMQTYFVLKRNIPRKTTTSKVTFADPPGRSSLNLGSDGPMDERRNSANGMAQIMRRISHHITSLGYEQTPGRQRVTFRPSLRTQDMELSRTMT